MTPLVKPSRIFHDVCAYWLTSSAGSSANAHGQGANRIANAIAAGLGARALSNVSGILGSRRSSIFTRLAIFAEVRRSRNTCHWQRDEVSSAPLRASQFLDTRSLVL